MRRLSRIRDNSQGSSRRIMIMRFRPANIRLIVAQPAPGAARSVLEKGPSLLYRPRRL
jgi:hypothetical protein